MGDKTYLVSPIMALMSNTTMLSFTSYINTAASDVISEIRLLFQELTGTRHTLLTIGVDRLVMESVWKLQMVCLPPVIGSLVFESTLGR